jgi:hypothetical protein
MNELEKTAREVLESIAEVNRLFQDAAVSFRRSPIVRGVATAIEISAYKSGPLIEGYLDVELKDGHGVSWRFDVRWTSDLWAIKALLEKNSSSGSEVLERLPIQEIHEVKLLPESLMRTAQRLLQLRPTDVVVQ